MKNTKYIILISLFSFLLFKVEAGRKTNLNTLNSKLSKISARLKERDTLHYISFGVIPYQFLSRSSGLYLKIGFKSLAIEYRPTYTYPTKYVDNFALTHEWFYYQGINNQVILHFSESKRTTLGVIVGYKYWWYSNQWIPADGTSTWSSYTFDNRQSAYMSGPCTGVEMNIKFSKNKFDGAFFANTLFTYFSGKRTVFETEQDPTYNNKFYPKYSNIDKFWFNIAIGLKFGFRSILK